VMGWTAPVTASMCQDEVVGCDTSSEPIRNTGPPGDAREPPRKGSGVYRHAPLAAPAMHVHLLAVADQRAKAAMTMGASAVMVGLRHRTMPKATLTLAAPCYGVRWQFGWQEADVTARKCQYSPFADTTAPNHLAESRLS
jgi:hypothetical protein